MPDPAPSRATSERADKAADAFRTISEVAVALDTPAHVLRFWESRFPQVKPVKRNGGRRYYRPADVALLGGIRRLLHDDGMTIRGVQKILREQGARHVATLALPAPSLAPPVEDVAASAMMASDEVVAEAPGGDPSEAAVPEEYREEPVSDEAPAGAFSDEAPAVDDGSWSDGDPEFDDDLAFDEMAFAAAEDPEPARELSDEMWEPAPEDALHEPVSPEVMQEAAPQEEPISPGVMQEETGLSGDTLPEEDPAGPEDDASPAVPAEAGQFAQDAGAPRLIDRPRRRLMLRPGAAPAFAAVHARLAALSRARAATAPEAGPPFLPASRSEALAEAQPDHGDSHS